MIEFMSGVYSFSVFKDFHSKYIFLIETKVTWDP